MKTKVIRFARLAAVAALALVSTFAGAANVVRIYFPEGNTFLGGSSPRVFSAPPSTIEAAESASGILVGAYDDRFRQWLFTFAPAAVSGQPLAVGTYSSVRDFNGSPMHPRLTIQPERATCDTDFARFAILELVRAPDGTLTKFAADFEVHCQSYGDVLTGNIRFNSDIPLDAPAPQAFASPMQLVDAGVSVMLDGTGSRDPAGTPLSYSWTQESGPAVALSAPGALQTTFTAPAVGPGGADLGFRLTVTNGASVSSSTTTSVHVYAPSDPRSLVYFDSPIGEYVGQGKQRLFTPEHGVFDVHPSGANGGVVVGYNGGESGAYAQFYPGSGTLSPGTYDIPTLTYIGMPGVNSMIFTVSSNGCDRTRGSFTVLDVSTGADGAILSLAIDFEQHCDNAVASLLGSIRFNSTVPYVARVATGVASSIQRACCDLNSFAVGSTGPAFAVRTVNVQGQPVSGRQVTFQVLDGCAIQVGGGASATVVSDVTGIATAPAATSNTSAVCTLRATLADTGASLDYTVIAYQPADVQFAFSPLAPLRTKADEPFFFSVTVSYRGGIPLTALPVSYRVLPGTAGTSSLTGTPVTDVLGAGSVNAIANSASGTYSIAVDAGGATGTLQVIQKKVTATLPRPDGGGDLRLTFFSDADSCVLAEASILPANALDAAPTTPPSGLSFPLGFVRIRTVGCAVGGGYNLWLQGPGIDFPMRFWTFAPTVNAPAGTWAMPFSSTSGGTASIGLQDGGVGDADGAANGSVSVLGGLALPATASGDVDGDGLPNGLETSMGHDPFVKDNVIFFDPRLFAMQQYRDFLGREGDADGIQFYANYIAASTITRAQAIERFFNSPEFSGSVSPIVRLYFATFLRIPDYDGLQFQVAALRSGAPLAGIATNFTLSPEFQQRYGALDNAAFVALLYQNILGRSASQGEIDFHVNRLVTGATRGDVLVGFSESPEFIQLSQADVFVTMMYVGMLRRAPEQAGFDYWVDYMEAGNPGLALIQGFLNAPEYRNRFQ